MNENLELIRQKCIEANPEIKERVTFDFIGTEIDKTTIRLADVLLTLGSTTRAIKGQIHLSWAGTPKWLVIKSRDDVAYRSHDGGCAWKMESDDLNEQSEETIDFVAELLR